jgi:branched-chain amino acid transport system permease protein
VAKKTITEYRWLEQSSHSMMWQLFINSLVFGAPIALLAVGFAVIYRVAGFIHFTHGIVFTVGAYLTFAMSGLLGVPLLASCIGALLGCSALGCIFEAVIFRRLHRKHAQPLVLLLASLGAYIVVQNLLSLSFGDQTQMIHASVVNEGLHAWGARITPIQVTSFCVSIGVLILVDVALRFTNLGQIFRAVANDAELAIGHGIATDLVIMGAFAFGSGLAGLAGLLTAWDVNAHPTMGLNALMFAIVAMIVGGTRSVWGIAAGAFLVALARNFGVWKVSSQWQDTVVFVILILFLLFRPQGFGDQRFKREAI